MTTDTALTVSTVEAGKRLGVRTAQVYKLALRGELDLVKDDKGLGRITIASIEAVEGRRRQP